MLDELKLIEAITPGYPRGASRTLPYFTDYLLDATSRAADIV